MGLQTLFSTFQAGHHSYLVYGLWAAEVLYGSDGKSRVDFVLHEATGMGSNRGGGGNGSGSSGSSGIEASTITTHVEVKSVTLAEDLPEVSSEALTSHNG